MIEVCTIEIQLLKKIINWKLEVIYLIYKYIELNKKASVFLLFV